MSTTIHHPKTMAGLTTRNLKPNSSQIRQNTSSNNPIDEKSRDNSALWTASNDSNDAVGHSTTNVNLRHIKRKDVESASFSRNKMLKNKTLPNLYSYHSKIAACTNTSAKIANKQLINPNKKFHLSNDRNKSFIDQTTNHNTNKNRVYESESTSRSGGTGEPNYAEFKRKVRGKATISSGDESNTSSLIKNALSKPHQTIYSKKISILTKENVHLKSEYNKLKSDIAILERTLEESKKIINENSIKLKHYENVIAQKDQKIHRLKVEFQEEKQTDSKIVTEYINAENYLLELVDEFTHGMRKIYSNDIDFKDVDIDGLPFCERFSNLLYNILLIIDFQKQFIMEQSSNQINQTQFNNECIIEEAENEEETENEGQNIYKHEEEENESEEESMSRTYDKELLLNPIQSNENMRYCQKPESRKCSSNYEQKVNEDSKADHDLNYDSKQSSDILSDKLMRQSSDYEFCESSGPQQEPPINRTIVTIQKELHKSLFSQNIMKINESPKVSLMTERSQKSTKYKNISNAFEKTNDGSNVNITPNSNLTATNPFRQDSIPNIFGMNVRPSSCEIVSASSESSRRSIKDSKYQMEFLGKSERSSEGSMSLESIMIQKSGNHLHKTSNSESADEAFTPNFITKRSSCGNNINIIDGKIDSSVFYKHKNKEVAAYDYRPPLVPGVYSERNQFNEDQFEDEFSDSMEGSEHMFSSNREDVEEFKTDLVFPKVSPKTN